MTHPADLVVRLWWRPVPSPDPRPRLAIVSTNGPEGIGGLAGYVRHLGEALEADFAITHVSRFRASGPTTLSYTAREQPARFALGDRAVRTIAPPRAAVPALRAARRLVYYPRLQPTARRLFRAGFGRPLAHAVPGDAELVHVVGTGWEMLGFSALPLARKHGAKLTISPAIHTGSWGDSALDATLYRATDAVIAYSRHERDRLVQLGVPPERVVVSGLAPGSYDGGDGDGFRARHGLGERPLVLFAARRQRYKGYHALREAMPAILAEVPDACLVVLGPDGDQPYPTLPRGAALELGLVDEATKADAFAACDVFCMPSAEESFGIVYTEAWSYGKPVVGGPAPAVRELIRDGVDGYTTTQEPQAIAEPLTRLLRDPGLRDRLGDAGRLRQQAEFTWAAVADRHRKTFMNLLGRG
jgi:glycosyltransferase involved in cell wall biosynthesis